MSAEPADIGALQAWAAILSSAGLVYAVRLAGVCLAGQWGDYPRAERFLSSLAPALLAGLVITAVDRHDWRAACGLVVGLVLSRTSMPYPLVLLAVLSSVAGLRAWI